MLIFKQEKLELNLKESLKDFNQFKKEWVKDEKIFISKLFNFSEFKKRKKNIFLALDFRNLNKFEIPHLDNLQEVDFIFINKKNFNWKKYLDKKIKLVYSFENFSFDSKKEIRKELEILFKKEKDLSGQKYNKILSNIFLEIPLNEYNEDEIFKAVVFLRKILVDILPDNNTRKIKILLKNNFSLKENEAILKNKLFKISGIIF